MSLRDAEPVPTLLSRVRQELAAEFVPGRPIRLSRAPGRLDVMGGIAEYTGSLVCQYPLECALAVALQPREDRQLQIFSFNLYDEHKPFTFRMPLDALANHSAEVLRREFSEPGRRWAAYVAGCLFVLHEQKLIDLRNPTITGLNLAVLGTVPQGAGVSSSSALEVATMTNLLGHFGIADRVTPMQMAQWCASVAKRLVGLPGAMMGPVMSWLGESGAMFRMVCQPHEIQPSLRFPDGVHVIGINSNVRRDDGGQAYTRTRSAAFMAHRMILEQMRHMGQSMRRELTGDPMRGYLANLDPDDYKRFFRPNLPEFIAGRDFLDRYGTTIDPLTAVEPDANYSPLHAADHHVLEARRVRRFVDFLERAARDTGDRRTHLLDNAGHLMYASHQSYAMDAMLGSDECDLLVQLVRRRERDGLYGARITATGGGGTVAVLANRSDRASTAIHQIMDVYDKQTGHRPELLAGTSAGAWHIGSSLVS